MPSRASSCRASQVASRRSAFSRRTSRTCRCSGGREACSRPACSPSGKRLQVRVTVRRPGWAGWLVGHTETRTFTVETPVAHLSNQWLQVSAGAPVTVSFDSSGQCCRVRPRPFSAAGEPAALRAGGNHRDRYPQRRCDRGCGSRALVGAALSRRAGQLVPRQAVRAAPRSAEAGRRDRAWTPAAPDLLRQRSGRARLGPPAALPGDPGKVATRRFAHTRVQADGARLPGRLEGASRAAGGDPPRRPARKRETDDDAALVGAARVDAASAGAPRRARLPAARLERRRSRPGVGTVPAHRGRAADEGTVHLALPEHAARVAVAMEAPATGTRSHAAR